MCLNFLDFNCADPRDALYAMLGLVSTKHQMPIDYNLSPAEVFWDAVFAADVDLLRLDRIAAKVRPERVVTLWQLMEVQGTEAGVSNADACLSLYFLFPGWRKLLLS
jgi:hypothetical protein